MNGQIYLNLDIIVLNSQRPAQHRTAMSIADITGPESSSTQLILQDTQFWAAFLMILVLDANAHGNSGEVPHVSG